MGFSLSFCIYIQTDLNLISIDSKLYVAGEKEK